MIRGIACRAGRAESLRHALAKADVIRYTAGDVTAAGVRVGIAQAAALPAEVTLAIHSAGGRAQGRAAGNEALENESA